MEWQSCLTSFKNAHWTRWRAASYDTAFTPFWNLTVHLHLNISCNGVLMISTPRVETNRSVWQGKCGWWESADMGTIQSQLSNKDINSTNHLSPSIQLGMSANRVHVYKCVVHISALTYINDSIIQPSSCHVHGQSSRHYWIKDIYARWQPIHQFHVSW